MVYPVKQDSKIIERKEKTSPEPTIRLYWIKNPIKKFIVAFAVTIGSLNWHFQESSKLSVKNVNI